MGNFSKDDPIYLEMAESVAKFSKATRRKVGSIVVDRNGKIVATGYNGTPTGVDNCCEDENDRTHDHVLHSEVNAIFNATTHDLAGATIYVTLSPCIKCAAAIVQKGFARVIYREQYRETSGIKFLEKYGIKVIQIQ